MPARTAIVSSSRVAVMLWQRNSSGWSMFSSMGSARVEWLPAGTAQTEPMKALVSGVESGVLARVADLASAEVDADRLRRDVAVLCESPRSRMHALAGIEAAERYILGEFDAAGWGSERMGYRFTGVSVKDPFPVWAFKLWPYTWAKRWEGANLVARFPATVEDADPGLRPLLIGAHYDTVSQTVGADDNASGVAVLLELARVLPGLPLRRPVVLVALDHEEMGKVGSKKAARHFTVTEPVAGFVNLESVGVFFDEPHTQRVPAQSNVWLRRQMRDLKAREFRGDFTAVVDRPGWEFPGLYMAASGHLMGDRSTIEVTDRRPGFADSLVASLVVRAAQFADRSDHVAFWKRRVPSVMLTSTAPFRNRHYHQMTDTPDRLDYDRLAGLTAALAAAVAVG